MRSFSQDDAVRAVLPLLGTDKFQTVLCAGFPGDDRTGMFLRLVEAALNKRRSAVVLSPEIVLSRNLVSRMFDRFSPAPVELHSGLTPAQYRRNWQELRQSRCRVVVGSRSAVFAPVPDLGLLIVDDEHDPSYKEQRKPRYNARDVAVMRTKLAQAVAVLASDTPSIESYYNGATGKYRLVDFARPAPPPRSAVTVVDRRREKGAALSKPLVVEIRKRLYGPDRIFLFINRRGFSPVVYCSDCGFAPRCSECKLPLAYHRQSGRFICHFCSRVQAGFDRCPRCQGMNFNYRGIGIERIEREVRSIDKRLSIVRLDSDSARGAGEFDRIVAEFNRGRAKVLVGTRRALGVLEASPGVLEASPGVLEASPGAPGRVTLAGVIDADTILNLPDFHAPERTFQILWRIISALGGGFRSGASHTGVRPTTIIQTFHPQHYAIRSAQRRNYRQFYRQELETRKTAGYPPFVRLALVRATGANRGALDAAVNRLDRLFEKTPGVTAAGPVLAPGEKKRQPVFQWLLKTKRDTPLHTVLDRRALLGLKAEVDIDVDPVEMM